MTNVTLALTPPPKCDEKPSAFFGQKWPFQEVKIFYFNHPIICQSLQSVFENFLPKIFLSEPKTANSLPFRAWNPPSQSVTFVTKKWFFLKASLTDGNYEQNCITLALRLRSRNVELRLAHPLKEQLLFPTHYRNSSILKWRPMKDLRVWPKTDLRGICEGVRDVGETWARKMKIPSSRQTMTVTDRQIDFVTPWDPDGAKNKTCQWD